MRILSLLTIAIFFPLIEILGFDCKTITKQKEFDNSKYIIIGEVLESGEDTFTVKVIEWLKNPISGELSFFIGNTSIIPDIGSTWIIYCRAESEGKFSASSCGWSSNLINPSLNYHFDFLRIPPMELINDEKSLYLVDELTNIRLANNLNNHISDLRNQKQIRILENGILASDKKFEKLSRLLLISSTLIFLLVVAYGLFSQKRSLLKD